MIDTVKFDYISKILRERILILDGAMGSLIQSYCNCGNHSEEITLSDFLVVDHPDLIKDIHRQYLKAGADIIETNSFNSNFFSLQDYGREMESYSLSKRAAELAKEVADEFTAANPEKPRFVAGSVGPTKYMLSLPQEDADYDFDKMAEAYTVQIKGLLDGGADIILLETVFDTLTVKAALYALSVIEEERGEKIPVMVSGTVANKSGRLLSGQNIEAFYTSVKHADLLSIGLNCGFGSEQVLPYLRRLSEIADTAVSIYPNAGLPDDCGEYHETPDIFVSNLEECLKGGLVNVIGGCCGTTPAHIKMLAEMASRFKPRYIPDKRMTLELSNLDYSNIGDSNELIQVGERTNVAGSAKFAKLVREKNFDGALDIAIKQVRNGARVIDVCMDDALEDSSLNMVAFLRMLNADDETGNVPVMIDSSDWNVIVKALKVCQGKGIVNSISLKDGEEEFINRAKEIKRLGAAAVVMLFDEKGQAATFERKCEVAERSYNLLVKNGFNPVDIIFDPNVLTVGTGMEKRDALALDFIKATKWIKENLKYVSVSGGISNLSFAFRGNNPLREAMHTVFLYHAGKAGLDMAIVNAGMMGIFADIEPQLLQLLKDLILCRTDNAVVPLINYINVKKNDKIEEEISEEENKLPLDRRFEKILLKGKDKEIESLVKEALESYTPLAVIDELLMPQMKKIGALFGEGKMFLPQVIKSAQVMKNAVAIIEPYLNRSSEDIKKKNVVIATVKGDVHDIGKNIVGLVASCNGFNVIDLGVRVDEQSIIDKAVETDAEAILLSGLISPSLNEMIKVCGELERRKLNIPVVIGGAATSEIHTAVKIAPTYSGPVFYSSDAAANLKILSSLSDSLICENRRRQEDLRKRYESNRDTRTEVRDRAVPSKTSELEKKTKEDVVVPKNMERLLIDNLPIEKVEKYIDWDWLFRSLDLERHRQSESGESYRYTKEGVLKDAAQIIECLKTQKKIKLEGVLQIFEARGTENSIYLKQQDGVVRRIPILRSDNGVDKGKGITDFLNDEADYIALFAVTAGIGLEEAVEELNKKNDYYAAVLTKLICDRLAEAFAQWIHELVASELWGFNEKSDGIRIAVGYPSVPDHTIKKDIFEILEVEKDTGMRLTETAMITPSESVCGFILSSGRYINVGRIGERQLLDYAEARGMTLEELKNIIPNNI